MNFTKARIAGAAIATAVAGATVVGAPTSSAHKSQTPKPEEVVIEMVQKGKKLEFAGPSKVAKGQKLQVVNTTSFKKIGPHTASLVDPALVPRNRKDGKECAQLGEDTVCGAIARAHKVDPKTFEIGKPDVDVGKKGWDKAFGSKGDTWYTEDEGDSETRKVTAKAGTELTLFCAVHPEMVKSIKVVKG